MSKIEWTDHTINPGIYGCTAISPACEHCYAATMARRLATMPHTAARYKGAATRVHGRDAWTGNVRVDYGAIEPAFAKLLKRKPARVFVTSMSDLFHKDVPDAFISQVFHEMAARPHLTFQVLTKRAQRMAKWSDWARWSLGETTYTHASLNRDGSMGLGGHRKEWRWPANVWAGCTVEDQQRANERIPWLRKVPAAARFLSMEPLLGPVELLSEPLMGLLGIHWVITGGESGSRARPSHPDWFRSIRDQCAAAGVPFFFKQWGKHQPSAASLGEVTADSEAGRHRYCRVAPRTPEPMDPLWNWGKNTAPLMVRGDNDPKTLDGVAHRAFPSGGER